VFSVLQESDPCSVSPKREKVSRAGRQLGLALACPTSQCD
jgi:hypothetical protein